jgi:phage terminase large subunit-like protein
MYEKAEWELPGAPEDQYLFDPKRANRVIKFIETYCTLPSGTKFRKAGQPFKLEPWQKQIITELFGTVRWSEDEQAYIRQFDDAWIEIARKNGKSTLLAAVALYLTGWDGEIGAQVFSVAKDKEQAGMVFKAAVTMIANNAILKRELKVYSASKTIVHERTGSNYKIISADANSALGTNPSAVIFDEVVSQPNRDLWDAMRTGMGARSQPLFLAITTAGYKSARFCLQEHEANVKLLENRQNPTRYYENEPTKFLFMRNTPDGADWEDPEVWKYANPNIGVTVSIDFFQNKAREAKSRPAAQNAFRAFYLNQWVAQESRWIDLAAWDRSTESVGLINKELLEVKMSGRDCYVGVDLASKQDLASYCLLFPGTPDDPDEPGYTVISRSWVPEAAIERRDKYQAELQMWVEEGWLYKTDGRGTDYEEIQQKLLQDCAKFNVLGVGTDPWNAQQLMQNVEAEANVEVVQVKQYSAALNEPTLLLEALVDTQKLYHCYNPVLRWNIENVQLKQDSAGVRIDKQKSAEKIDAVAALINALKIATLPREQEQAATFISFFDE